MRRAFMPLIYFTIIIGFIALTLNMTIGKNTISFLYPSSQGNGILMWKYDLASYIKNIKDNATQVTELELTLPDREWQNLSILEFGEQLGNNLALILDWIIFVINIFIYPLRIGAYFLRNFMAIIGINVTSPSGNGLWWLRQIVNFLISLQIPMV